jgi:hypothetical protein
MWILILKSRAVDPDSAFQVNPDTDPDPGFWWPKTEEKKSSKKFFFLFWSKIAIYLSIGHHKGPLSYRRSLWPSKENVQLFKKWNLLTLFYVCGSFLPFLDSDTDQGTPLYPDPIRIRIRVHNTVLNHGLKIVTIFI